MGEARPEGEAYGRFDSGSCPKRDLVQLQAASFQPRREREQGQSSVTPLNDASVRVVVTYCSVERHRAEILGRALATRSDQPSVSRMVLVSTQAVSVDRDITSEYQVRTLAGSMVAPKRRGMPASLVANRLAAKATATAGIRMPEREGSSPSGDDRCGGKRVRPHRPSLIPYCGWGQRGEVSLPLKRATADVAVSLVASGMAGDRDSRNFEITVGSFPTVGTD